jgi:hypothetical protein
MHFLFKFSFHCNQASSLFASVLMKLFVPLPHFIDDNNSPNCRYLSLANKIRKRCVDAFAIKNTHTRLLTKFNKPCRWKLETKIEMRWKNGVTGNEISMCTKSPHLIPLFLCLAVRKCRLQNCFEYISVVEIPMIRSSGIAKGCGETFHHSPYSTRKKLCLIAIKLIQHFLSCNFSPLPPSVAFPARTRQLFFS